MNYLAHLFLSSQTTESHIGSLLADFIHIGNNQLSKFYSTGIVNAIIDHRKVDVFTDTHADTSSAVHLIFSKYRHYSRILIDIFFDHFLTIHWDKYADIQIKEFVNSVYLSFTSLPSGLPEKFYIFSERMRAHNILLAYGKIEDLKEVLKRTESKIKNKPGIDTAWEDLICYYDKFDQLFQSFFPQVINYLSDLEKRTL